MPEVAKPRLKAQPARTYETLIRLYIVPGLGGKRLDKLTVRHVRSFFNRITALCTCCDQGKDQARPEAKRRCCAIGNCCQRRLSPNTIRDIKKVLVVALNDAIVEELITNNVAALVKLPTIRRRKVKPWSVEEARQFLVSARAAGDPLYAVEHSLQRVNGALVLGDTKTETSDAPLPLIDICVAALQLRQEDQHRHKRDLQARWPDRHNLVFTTRTGSPVDPRNFLRSFVNRCERAGVRRIRVHDTRPAGACLLHSTYTRE